MPNSRLEGFGGVARDDKGRWIGEFYGRLSMKATSSLTSQLFDSNKKLQVEEGCY